MLSREGAKECKGKLTNDSDRPKERKENWVGIQHAEKQNVHEQQQQQKTAKEHTSWREIGFRNRQLCRTRTSPENAKNRSRRDQFLEDEQNVAQNYTVMS